VKKRALEKEGSKLPKSSGGEMPPPPRKKERSIQRDISRFSPPLLFFSPPPICKMYEHVVFFTMKLVRFSLKKKHWPRNTPCTTKLITMHFLLLLSIRLFEYSFLSPGPPWAKKLGGNCKMR
jgi:hypothetical protein